MGDQSAADITRMLIELRPEGSHRKEVSDRLYSAVYDQLRQIAGGMMSRERVGHTLQPTALVHEAYLKLVDETRIDWQNRAHFFGIAARAMRQVLVDHARRHQADKRGGQWQRVTLDENLMDPEQLSVDILALHDALDRLSATDARMARVVELRVFAGLLAREAAHVLGVSKRTVDADWKVAKMWLARELAGRDGI